MLTAGARNNFIEIHAPVVAQNDWGQPESTWAKHVGVWAKLKPARVTDVVSPLANQEAGEMLAQMNYRDDIQSGWRVLWKGQWFTIVGDPSDKDGARRTLELSLRRVRA